VTFQFQFKDPIHVHDPRTKQGYKYKFILRAIYAQFTCRICTVKVELQYGIGGYSIASRYAKVAQNSFVPQDPSLARRPPVSVPLRYSWPLAVDMHVYLCESTRIYIATGLVEFTIGRLLSYTVSLKAACAAKKPAIDRQIAA